MIKFLSLEIENFLSVKNALVDLNNQGLVLIEGVNKDDPSAASNGAGKSSIVDAISWCLYGETARGASGDSVVNIKAGKNCLVTLKVEIDGTMWLIERGRKHHKYKNRVMIYAFDDMDGTYADRTLGTDKLTQEKINHLMGCTPDIFNASIYMGQEAMPDLPGMTDKALKAIIEQALSLDKLDDALEVCKDRAATALHVAHKAHNDLTKLEDDYDRDNQALHDLSNRMALLQSERAKMDAIIVNSTIAHSGIMTKYNDNLETLVKAAKALPVIDVEGAHEAADKVYADSMVAARAVQEKLVKVRAKVGELTYEWKGLLGKIKVTETECPTCHRPHDHAAEAARIKQEATDRMEVIGKDIDKLGLVEQQLEDELTQATHKANQDRKDYLADTAQIARQRQAADRAVMEVEREIAEYEATYKADMRANTNLRDAKDEQMANVKREMIALGLKCRDMQLEIDAAKRDRDAANDRLAVLDKVKHIMGRKGFRGEVLDQITPYLNSRTAYYLSQLTDENIEATWNTITTNSNGDYVENFHIAIEHKSGVNKFANLSGGEKRKVRLACAMAMQDLIGTRAVKPIKLFVADEIDDAIDEAGLELLMGVLEQKAKEVGTVFIISHNDIGDWVRNKITVVKENGQSTFKTP